jgi:hypothetical protein
MTWLVGKSLIATPLKHPILKKLRDGLVSPVLLAHGRILIDVLVLIWIGWFAW